MRHLNPNRSLLRGRNRAGISLIEVLVAALIMILIGIGLAGLVRGGYESQNRVMGQNTVNTDARNAVDTMTDHLRGAASITSAAVSDLTFIDGSGKTVRYWLTGGELRRTSNSLPTGGLSIAANVSTLTFSYVSWSGTAWTTSGSPSDLSKIGAIDVTLSLSRSGGARQMSGSVRLRARRF